MTWTVDESRVRPFLSAAERRDVTGMLRGAPQRGRTFSETEEADAGPVPAGPEARKRWKDSKDFKDFKDIKDGKDGKDGKESKDVKDGKETKESKDVKDNKDNKDGKDSKDTKDYKDSKDSKDTKDGKDGKDGKDFKDGFDGAMTLPGPDVFVNPAAESAAGAGSGPADAGMGQAAPALAGRLTEEQEIAAELRNSRINRLLRRRGVVI